MNIHSVHASIFTLLAVLVSLGMCKVVSTTITPTTNHTSSTSSIHVLKTAATTSHVPSTGVKLDNSTSWPTVNATTPSPKPEANNPPKKNVSFATISAEELNEVKALCANGHCMNQSAASIARRAYVKQLWMRVLQWTSPYSTNAQLAASKAEAYMHKSFIAKYVLMRLFGFPAKLVSLTPAMPSDDGIFEGDVMLPELATDAIIRKGSSFASELQSDVAVQGADANEGERYWHHHHHGWPWYPWYYAQMEEPPVRADQQNDVTWRSTVYYHLDKNIGESDSALILDAINTIANATSCLSFIARSNVSENEFSDTIIFSKMPNASSPISSCTLSTLGNLPMNFVFANFSCPNIKGELLHAIMHTLGAVHEHNRADRNDHLVINWSKLSPDALDYFVLDRAHAVLTFGTPFDFGSIMAFPSTTGDQSVTPKNVAGTQPLLGQRVRLSCADEQLLRRIYCCSQACADRKGICGLWASTGECASKTSWFWMRKNCPRSCDRCCKNECSMACADHCAEQAREN